jgi:hypothetical protein
MILNLVSGHLWWADCFIVTHQISEDSLSDEAQVLSCRPLKSASRLVLRSHTFDPGTPSMSALASEARSTGGTLGKGGSEARSTTRT